MDIAIQSTNLRIPTKLYKQLKEDAKKNRRSTSAHIVWILEKYIESELKNDKSDHN